MSACRSRRHECNGSKNTRYCSKRVWHYSSLVRWLKPKTLKSLLLDVDTDWVLSETRFEQTLLQLLKMAANDGEGHAVCDEHDQAAARWSSQWSINMWREEGTVETVENRLKLMQAVGGKSTSKTLRRAWREGVVVRREHGTSLRARRCAWRQGKRGVGLAIGKAGFGRSTRLRSRG